MSSDPANPGGTWRFERPDQHLADLHARCASFVPAYEEMLVSQDDDELTTTIHTRRLTPMGCALQVFENEAFFEVDGEVCGVMTFFCTESTDAVGETPTSYFYQLYRNAGPAFEQIGRRVLQYHAEHASPLDPRNATLAGLYGNLNTALLHVTTCELRDGFRGQRRLASLVKTVERLRVRGNRHLVHADNPFAAGGSPDDDAVELWEERYDEEIAVQLARRIGYLTISAQPAATQSPDRSRLRAYVEQVAIELVSDDRPVLVIAGEADEVIEQP
jgi:hypothetical protein